ncbi:MAG: TIGR00730 family Rossman fold protein [Pseudomonadota bacterium]
MSTNGKRGSVCVYCGSREGRVPAFGLAADAVGRAIAEAGLRLVYGAGDVGLMGRVARSAQAAGSDIVGVIPQHLVDLEIGKVDVTRYIITETMHERKKVMFTNADAVLALPGGPGTLDELFEVLTWRQLGLHAKPIVLLNVDGYWDGLVALIDGIVAQGFAEPSFRAFLEVETDPEAAVARIVAAVAEG